MFLTVATTGAAGVPATDLGFLLHKNPARVQSFDLSFGRAHVFYPEASPERCSAALLLDVDPIGLVRRPGEAALAQYVSDRPYVASSFLSVAIGEVYGSAGAASRCCVGSSSRSATRSRPDAIGSTSASPSGARAPTSPSPSAARRA